MSSPQVGEWTIVRGKSRLFDDFLQFLTTYDAISIALHQVRKVAFVSKLGDFGHAEAHQFPLRVKHVLGGLMEAALTEPVGGFPIAVQALDQPATGFKTSAFQQIVSDTISPIFVNYYERHGLWINSNISSDTYQWPPPWNFARVIRNACSHSGKINWNNVKAQPISWHHINYSSADNGRLVIGKEFVLGDILILMLEMDRALDQAGCPI